MRGAMLALAAGCVAIGLAPILFWPAVAAAVGAWRPSGADLRPPTPLLTLGWVHLVLAMLAVAAAAWLLHRARRAGLRRTPTWGGGFAAPTARMQYTAGSFAGIITGWFAFILQPERHEQRPVEPFPVASSRVEHTPEPVLRYLVEPVSTVVLRAATAARALQHGGVQSYLLYLLFGIAALAGVVLSGGQP